MSRYPEAEWVPWKYNTGNGPAYYKGQNRPIAVVQHVMQGYARTARQWAEEGYNSASWHFTTARDGHIMQHLDFPDGGYHAGIPSSAPKPKWKLWKGHQLNVNLYTLGNEHEGFSGVPFTEKQTAASKRLNQWCAKELDVPLDEDHFPPHAAIDLINRPNDFHPPAMRAEFYRYLFAQEEDDLSAEEKALLNSVVAALGGKEAIDAWNLRGNSLLAGYALEQQKLGEHIALPHTSADVSAVTVTGGVSEERLAEAIAKHAHSGVADIRTTGGIAT